MEDAHAHPPSPANTLHTRPRSITSLTLRDQHPSQSTPKSAPHNRHQRLLHTRHAKFPAQRLSVNGITISFPESSYYSAPRFTKREEDGNYTDKTGDLSGTSPRSSILNEIANSAVYRVRGLERRGPIPVFQDSSDKELLEKDNAETNSPSIYHDVSTTFHTPSVTGSIPDCSPGMGLREVSVNLQRPSPSKDAPYHRPFRTGPRRISSQGKLRFNSEDYIDHIENELQLVKDAMYSPTTNTSWKEKLKKAKEENDRLRKEIEMMRSSFELELHQTVERSTETELRLKRRIKDLEDEIELKQTVITDLELDQEEKRLNHTTLEVLKTRMEKMAEEKNTLEITNLDVMKRNEVLTHLLALSPTKLHQSFDLPTPRRKSARPMSMIMPRVPSSPVVQTPGSRPQSILVSPALLASDYYPVDPASSPLSSNLGGMSTGSPRAPDDNQSIDSGLGVSCSRFTNTTGSRRSTLASLASTSPELGPQAQPESRPLGLARQPSKRRPRKFMPGSTQLRPLLLPTFTADYGNLPSPSPITSPKRPCSMIIASGASYVPQWAPASVSQGDTSSTTPPLSSSEDANGQPGPSFQSLDEVFAEDEDRFLPESAEHPLSDLNHEEYFPKYHTPVQPRIEESNPRFSSPDKLENLPRVDSWVLRTINTTSGGGDHEADNDSARHNTVETIASPKLVPELDKDCISHAFEPFTARKLHDIVEIPRPLFSKERLSGMEQMQSLSDYGYDQSPLNPRKRRKASSRLESGNLDDVPPDPGDPDAPGDPAGPRHILTPSSIINRVAEPVSHSQAPSPKKGSRAVRARSPLELLQQRNIGARPLAAVTIQTVYATLSRYTSYIQTFKRDPLALARRVIANAWRSNWALFGKLSWWVLGLFVGYPRPTNDRTAWDWDQYDGESIADRCCMPHVDDAVLTNQSNLGPESPSKPPTRQNDETPEAEEQPADMPKTPEEKEPRIGWGKSLLLWGKFSVAIMLAVGGAIVKGPAEMLRDTDERRPRQNSVNETVASRQGHQCRHVFDTGEATPRIESRKQLRVYASSSNLEGIGTSTSSRKARSHSSPTPLSHGYQLQIVNAEPANCAMPADAMFGHALDEETLKPSRRERKGLDSVFTPPCHEQGECGSSIALKGTAHGAVEDYNNQTMTQSSDHG